MSTMSQLPVTTNLADPELIPSEGGPPHGLLAQWRENDPVHWNPPNADYNPTMVGATISKGFWVLTHYKDVFDVSRDPHLFSSHDGGPIIWDFEPEQLAIQQAGMMGMTPERHAQVKRLVLPPFAPKELAGLEPEIQAVAREIVDDVAAKGSCEFVFDVASRLPVYTFCKLLGVPDELRETVYKLGNAAADVESYKSDEDQSAAFQLFAIAEQLAAEKREKPDDTMLSRVIHGDVDGEKLDDVNINMFFVTLSIAGHETTRATAAHFIRLMNEHPEQYKLLRSDVDKHLPNAIDEVLRFSPPVIKFRRTATADTEVHGQKIAKGDKIYLSYPAANRDPEVFENPDVFDITRKNASKHLAFGTGPHVCLGARLAHMQLRALLKEIITRIPDIHPAGDMTMLKTIWFNGIINMPVEFTPETPNG